MDYSSGAAWMHGQIIPISEAKISVFDWGLTRSDITYDVVHVWEGAFFRLDDYMSRFHALMKKLRLDVGLDRSEICYVSIVLLTNSGLRSAYVSMVASRGTPIVPGAQTTRLQKPFLSLGSAICLGGPAGRGKKGGAYFCCRKSKTHFT